MDPGRWNEPVTFETQRLGQCRTIASADDAARGLLMDWPVHSGHAFIKAQKACLAVLGGRETPEAAREAFRTATEEAGMFVRDS
ncbi:DUF982 domain-containing protein [Shinella zoogloeoides]